MFSRFFKSMKHAWRAQCPHDESAAPLHEKRRHRHFVTSTVTFRQTFCPASGTNDAWANMLVAGTNGSLRVRLCGKQVSAKRDLTPSWVPDFHRLLRDYCTVGRRVVPKPEDDPGRRSEDTKRKGCQQRIWCHRRLMLCRRRERVSIMVYEEPESMNSALRFA